MAEIPLEPRTQETIPDNLMFERFDDEGSGIATLPDGRYIVEVGERPSYLKGSERMVRRYDLSLAIHFIEQEPDIATWYGYHYLPPEEGGLARVVIPSPEQLNERKNSLPPEIGVNRGRFKVQEGSRFGAVEYLGMLGGDEIPVATETNEEAHDLCAHAGGFTIMSAELFDFLGATARDALGRDDPSGDRHRGDATNMIDQVSAWLTGHPSEVSGTQIRMVHTLRIPRNELRAIVNSLQESQDRTNEAFREYARAQNQLA